MLLCIDIGNTNIKLGLFDGESMRCRWRIATDRERLTDEYAMLLLNLLSTEGLEIHEIHGCAISSVVPVLSQVFGELSERYLKQEPLILGPGTNTGMQVHTDYPAEVGADLIVNALAARRLYGTPVIVVGFGTATTFVAVSTQGDLEGVAIAPGVLTSGDSLFRSTATLPQIVLSRPAVAVGKNTINSLRSGMVFGFAGLVDGLVERIQSELGGGARVVATGGLANLIAPETKAIEAVEPDLGLIGLRLLYEINGAA
jgi:type III pantothenate kinase